MILPQIREWREDDPVRADHCVAHLDARGREARRPGIEAGTQAPESL
jgi:hypothetical protein